jgi:hypothetical protein
MATTHHGCRAKNAPTPSRRRRRDHTRAPSPSTPCTWKTFFAKSSPINLTSVIGRSPLVRRSRPSPWHIDAIRGPSNASIQSSVDTGLRGVMDCFPPDCDPGDRCVVSARGLAAAAHRGCAGLPARIVRGTAVGLRALVD